MKVWTVLIMTEKADFVVTGRVVVFASELAARRFADEIRGEPLKSVFVDEQDVHE